jgi:hypothetical protein
LVGNELVYDLKLDKQLFQGDAKYLAYKLSEIAIQDKWQAENLGDLSHEDRETLRKNVESEILSKFSSKGNWPKLLDKLSKTSKEEIEKIGNAYLYFDETYQRFYPEASMAAINWFCRTR